MRPYLRYILILIAFVLLLALAAALEYFGIIWHNDLFAWPYQVKGFDVSHHQGDIDWHMVRAEHDFRFVFIKATEGQDFIDKRFKENWREAKKQGLLVGAYHFFSMQSLGARQANNFIRTVPKEPDSLPPVIDVEIHLNHDRRKVHRELLVLSQRLEQHYGQKPILYVTYDTYGQYIESSFPTHPIWIRDIKKFPTLDRNWLFWQYSNRGRIQGIDTYVDINAYHGELDEFLQHFTTAK
ncbi:glycoside hydrolase family 25 protein [Laceyella tengchongensis]